MRSIAPLTILTLSCLGCANVVSVYPTRTMTAQTIWAAADPGRANPQIRHSRFQANYEYVVDCEFNSDMGRVPPQCSPLIYPPARQQGAAWEYLFLGRDFAAAGDDKAAGLEYWAALTLSGSSMVSRPEKERLRGEALRELAKLASRRGATRWAALLSLSGQFADMYLQSGAANHDKDAFYNVVDQLKAAEMNIQGAKSEANTAAMAGMIGAMTTGMQGIAASKAGNTGLGGQLQQQAVMQVVAVDAQHREASQAINSVAQAMGPKADQVAAVVAEDVQQIEANRSLVRTAAIFYLSTTTEQGPYLAALRAFAKGKPKVMAVLRDVANEQATEEQILALGDTLLELEMLVAKYERRGERVPPELARQLWLD